MTKKEIVEQIELLVRHKNAIDEKYNKLYEVFGENEIMDASWGVYEDLLNFIEVQAGDTDNAIGFFIFDCNCGKQKPHVKLHYPKFKTAKDVAKYIKGK
jgi:hypothetical protein